MGLCIAINLSNPILNTVQIKIFLEYLESVYAAIDGLVAIAFLLSLLLTVYKNNAVKSQVKR